MCNSAVLISLLKLCMQGKAGMIKASKKLSYSKR